MREDISLLRVSENMNWFQPSLKDHTVLLKMFVFYCDTCSILDGLVSLFGPGWVLLLHMLWHTHTQDYPCRDQEIMEILISRGIVT